MTELLLKYKSKLRLLSYYRNEKKNNLVNLLIKNLKQELAGLEKLLAEERAELL